MTKKIDPRVKLLFVICISSLGLAFTKFSMLLAVFFIGLLISHVLKADLFMLLKRIKIMLYLFVVLVVIQSIFVRSGDSLVNLGGITILTSEGLSRGFAYLMRVLIILISGAIIATCDMRRLIQGLIQMKLPYDFAFMTSIGVKFLPLLMEELKDTLTAIQLRGIDIGKLQLKERIEIISYIFTPVFVGALSKAKKLSLSVECRGFRAFDNRTSILTLKFSPFDYLAITLTFILTATLIITNQYFI
ncbi:MAG: ABC-type cobalt transport system permease [Clostridiales bacterium 38_11]|nr:MAG: ABC-type cobalt transport system permease [Clostridiales bacterium 38_11]HBH13694.1 energy-coupling factor transporter transmembrane protein EcfT [Clostridiales bacterium]